MITGKYFITPHAVYRFIERIRPDINNYDFALSIIIKAINASTEKLIDSEKRMSFYLPVNTTERFLAVIDKGKALKSVVTIVPLYNNFHIKHYSKYKYSQELYLKLNYGRMTYSEMRTFMPEHTEKSISYKAVKMGLSNKKNWSPYECIVALYYPNKTGGKLIKRSINALKIKRCRLTKSLLNY